MSSGWTAKIFRVLQQHIDQAKQLEFYDTQSERKQVSCVADRKPFWCEVIVHGRDRKPVGRTSKGEAKKAPDGCQGYIGESYEQFKKRPQGAVVKSGGKASLIKRPGKPARWRVR